MYTKAELLDFASVFDLLKSDRIMFLNDKLTTLPSNWSHWHQLVIAALKCPYRMLFTVIENTPNSAFINWDQVLEMAMKQDFSALQLILKKAPLQQIGNWAKHLECAVTQDIARFKLVLSKARLNTDINWGELALSAVEQSSQHLRAVLEATPPEVKLDQFELQRIASKAASQASEDCLILTLESAPTNTNFDWQWLARVAISQGTPRLQMIFERAPPQTFQD